MILQFRIGTRLACAIFCCLFSTLTPAVAESEDLLVWRGAQSLSHLTYQLDDWLDSNTDLPRRADPSEIRFVDKFSAAALSASNHSAGTGNLRGLYDPDSQTIWLVLPWNLRDPYNVSVLLHEQIHHRQTDAGHWYCPGAQELPAYRIQQVWLAQFGLEPNVNWIAVVLEAGCTPKDIHPG